MNFSGIKAIIFLSVLMSVSVFAGIWVERTQNVRIRTFSGVHTLVWKDTLWRLEPVELEKAVLGSVQGIYNVCK